MATPVFVATKGQQKHQNLVRFSQQKSSKFLPRHPVIPGDWIDVWKPTHSLSGIWMSTR